MASDSSAEPSSGASPGGSSAAGSDTVNVLPCPTAVSTLIRPPMASTMDDTM